MSFGVIAASVAIASAVAGTYMSVQGQKAQSKANTVAAENAQMRAEWNAKEARNQAKFEEQTAQTNMRRKRENNRRAIARQRAVGARSGLADSGAVSDMILDKSERLQTDIDDIWDAASVRSQQLQGESIMNIWQGEQTMAADKYSKVGDKYAIYGTIASGVGKVASAGMQMKGALPSGGAAGNSTAGAPKAYTVDGTY